MAVSVLTLERASALSSAYDAPEASILNDIKIRRSQKMAEMARFAQLCDRFDNLYYPNTVNQYGGADHWPEDPSATTPNQVHVSVNVYTTYVDIPASLQSAEPIENILPIEDSPQTRQIAAAVERAYFAWKDAEDFEMKGHQACVVKGLYGRTAAKVYWDEEENRPCFEVVDQPRNLWLGWASKNYRKLDWTLYTYLISIDEAMAQYGVDFDSAELNEGGEVVRLPYLSLKNRDMALNTSPNFLTARDWMTEDLYMVECVDYWYRKPKEGAEIKLGEPTPMETWNAIFVGNFCVKDMPHPEYEGRMPYVVLFNSYIPGLPDGRGELYDIEQLIREKDERISAGGQMIRKAVAGQYWQLTGAEAPDVVPTGMKPKEDTVIAPGAGNRVEKIEPFLPSFQLEEYLARIDRELVDVSGLNDLLRGIAPARVLSSSKALNALVANYEARIRIKRDLFFRWRTKIWDMAVLIWGNKNPELKAMFAIASKLSIKAPSITPRDDIETATMATNLLNAKIWTLARAMDSVGVDDPEGEIGQVKEERTDATLFPSDVLQMASLMATFQQLGQQQQAQQIAQQQAQGQMGQGAPVAGAQQAGQAANGMRQQMGGFMGQPQMNASGEQLITPPGAMPTGPGGLPPSGPGQNFMAQTQINDQGARSRLLLQTPIAPEQGAAGGNTGPGNAPGSGGY